MIYINYLHGGLVIVSVDKASNNFVIVCSKSSLYLIKHEVGIFDDEDNDIHKFHEQKLLSTFR